MDNILNIFNKIKSTCEAKTGNFVDIRNNKFICPNTCSKACTVTIDQIAEEPYYDETCVTKAFNEYLSTLDSTTKTNIENECKASSTNTTNFKNNIIALCDVGITQIADATTSCKMDKVLNSKVSTKTATTTHSITLVDICIFSLLGISCLIVCVGYLDIYLKILFVLLFSVSGFVYYLYQFKNDEFKKLMSSLQTQSSQK